jgi:choline kinase
MARGIILAAGRGSRMGKETEAKPKCLTILNGKSLLEWQLNSLRQAGIEAVNIVTGYKSELLQPFVSKTYHNSDWANTNMVSSLFCAPPAETDTIISYSDITYSHEHVKALKNSPHDIVITADRKWLKLWSMRFSNPLDDAETFICNGKKLLSIGTKTTDLAHIQAQFMGLIKLTKKGWMTLLNLFQELSDETQRKMDMTTILNLLLTNSVNVHIEFVEGKWCECDTYHDVLCYEKELKNNPTWIHNWT